MVRLCRWIQVVFYSLQQFKLVFETFTAFCLTLLCSPIVAFHKALSSCGRLLWHCWTKRHCAFSVHIIQHTSNCFLEYLPLRTPDGHAMVYCSLSYTSTITSSRFLGSPRPLSTAGMGTATLSPSSPANVMHTLQSLVSFSLIQAINMSLMSEFARTTEPWLWGCLGFPCTITNSVHNAISSLTTAAVNSHPLLLCKTWGAPNIRKISISW